MMILLCLFVVVGYLLFPQWFSCHKPNSWACLVFTLLTTHSDNGKVVAPLSSKKVRVFGLLWIKGKWIRFAVLNQTEYIFFVIVLLWNEFQFDSWP